jgi:DNA-binding CsgD family transcriptional regulator
VVEEVKNWLMPNLAKREWGPLFDAVYEMNTARDHADLLSAVATGMSRLIQADQTIVHILDRRTQKMAFRMLPECRYTQDELDYYAANPGGNPLVEHFARTGDANARRMSDVITPKDYLVSPHYVNCNKRLGFAHTLALPVNVNQDTVGALSFDRCKANFTKRHCALLDAFAPHFLLAWSRHPDPWVSTEKAKVPSRVRLQQLGLTARQADVLYWMTEGKQNREIAMILGRSLATVQEHVENILEKVGQENRHSTTVFALRYLAST